MDIDRDTAELGWKSNDEPRCGPVHRLATNSSDDLNSAFRTLLRKMNQPGRQQDVIMEIEHLVRPASIIRLLTKMFMEPYSNPAAEGWE